MLQTVSRLLPELPLFLMTAVATHLVMSFAQTLMHYKLGHHSMGEGTKSRRDAGWYNTPLITELLGAARTGRPRDVKRD